MSMPHHTAKGPGTPDIANAVDEFLRRENPLRFSTDIREYPYEGYDSFVPHIVLLIKNGCGAQEIANYLEKLLLQRSWQSDRDALVKVAERLLKAVLPPNTSLERTRDR